MRLQGCPAHLAAVLPQHQTVKLELRFKLNPDDLADDWGSALLAPFDEVLAAFAERGHDCRMQFAASAMGGEPHQLRIVGSDDPGAEPLAVIQGTFCGKAAFVITRRADDPDELTMTVRVSVGWGDMPDGALADMVGSYKGGGKDAGKVWLDVAPVQTDIVNDGVRIRKGDDRQQDLLDGPAVDADADALAGADAPPR